VNSRNGIDQHHDEADAAGDGYFGSGWVQIPAPHLGMRIAVTDTRSVSS
jgi:hypothetical protein